MTVKCSLRRATGTLALSMLLSHMDYSLTDKTLAAIFNVLCCKRIPTCFCHVYEQVNPALTWFSIGGKGDLCVCVSTMQHVLPNYKNMRLWAGWKM